LSKQTQGRNAKDIALAKLQTPEEARPDDDTHALVLNAIWRPAHRPYLIVGQPTHDAYRGRTV
jgi:hypothetical protein